MQSSVLHSGHNQETRASEQIALNSEFWITLYASGHIQPSSVADYGVQRAREGSQALGTSPAAMLGAGGADAALQNLNRAEVRGDLDNKPCNIMFALFSCWLAGERGASWRVRRWLGLVWLLRGILGYVRG